MRTAIVVSVHKGGSYTDAGNYMLISILPSIDKILERHMANLMFGFMEKYNIVSKIQFEKLLETVRNAVDNRMSVILHFIDFKKEFYTVNHDILFDKQYIIGISATMEDWFKS
ncbi:hypothetical protein J437_LFUL007313 [Ladona fulva]|uniref:Uncharacterized protein n=1 Tax=Ladona fulva TaxID=123851 RepID=A0A8K0KTF7_LADFU|nr:hypothetical protein J437_LFUL007313 [Ladona fulva]